MKFVNLREKKFFSPKCATRAGEIKKKFPWLVDRKQRYFTKVFVLLYVQDATTFVLNCA